MKPPKTFTELINRAYDIIGVPLRLIDNNERLLSGKGGIGQMIEESWFGQKPHNDPSPDFKNLGVELITWKSTKTTNLRQALFI